MFEKKSTREAVISVLSEEWPLTAQGLFLRIVRQNKTQLSYQAVHKVLQQLLKEGVLEKRVRGYQLNQRWLQEMRQHSDEIAQKYAAKALQNQTGLTAHSLYEVDKLLLELVSKNLPQTEKIFLGTVWNHFWVPLFLSKKEYLQIKALHQYFDWYAISKGNTKIDQWCANFWNNAGAHAKAGIKTKVQDSILFSDSIIQVHYPPSILQKLDRFYKKTKQVEDLNTNQLFDPIFLEPTAIPITINQNKALFEQLKKQIQKEFSP